MRLPYDRPPAIGRPFIQLAHEVAAAIMQTIEAGWRVGKCASISTAARGEVEITERLREGMRRALEEEELPWREEMIVLPGTESLSHPDLPRPDGRTDIPIFMIGIWLGHRVHEPHAIVECKRVDGSNADLCRLYVVEGMDRFRQGHYSENHSTAFMAGYVIAGNERTAVDRINQYLTSKGVFGGHGSADAERLRPSSILAGGWAWESRHGRATGSPVELHHAFLTFSEA